MSDKISSLLTAKSSFDQAALTFLTLFRFSQDFGRVSFQSHSRLCGYHKKGHFFSKSDYKLGTLIKSITDVWFILDIQPFFALCDKKNYLKIQNEAG